jgi:hypothetical protein
MRICVFWDGKTVSSAGMAPFHSETGQWLHPEDFLFTRNKLSLKHEGSVFLQYFMNHWPRNMVSHTRSLILNYCVGTPHISSKLFTSQHPSLALVSLWLSRQSLPRTEPGSGHFASQYFSFLSLLITLLPSLSQTTTCTQRSNENVGRATQSDLETCSSKEALGTTPLSTKQ